MIRFCIILGAMKAGTTSLYNYLAQHPEISPCRKKEPNFFSQFYDENAQQYLDLWPKEDLDSKILLEASTDFTKLPKYPDTSQNLLDFSEKHNAEMRFIFVMRNPFDRIESHYTFLFARWTNETLAERLNKGHFIPESCYAYQLDPYFDKFEHNNFLLLDFEDLKKKPDELLKRICGFLEIDADYPFSGLEKVHMKSKGTVIIKPLNNLYTKYPLIQSFSNLFPKGFKRYLAKYLFQKKSPKISS